VFLTLISTSLAGILSNPLFTLVNHSVADVPMLQGRSLVARNSLLGKGKGRSQPIAAVSAPQIVSPSLPNLQLDPT
jgi:hypothetical protein